MKRIVICLVLVVSLISTSSLVAQVTAYPPSDFIICDEVPNDGFAEFDLTLLNDQIIGGQDPTNLVITYHQIWEGANNGVNPITNPTTFVNVSNPQIIWARLEDSSNGDYDTTEVYLGVFESPVVNSPTPLYVCDDDNDGFAEFILTVKDDEIIGGEPGVTISYYETILDAEFVVNPIVGPYYNLIQFFQTIYVRAEFNVSGCFTITVMDLIVELSPEVIIVSDLVAVDNDGDGFAFFDLTSKIPEILNGQTDVYVSFYMTQSDANIGVNTIANPTSFFNTTNPQTIYTRLENIESCFAVGEFDLVLVDAIIEEEPDDLYINEGDNDGFAIFDLTINEPQMLGGQDPLIALFTYHVSLEDATNGLNSIATPTAYENIINPQTIYVRLTNSNTGFYVLTSFNIETDGNLSIENNFINNLKLYPNPTTDFVNLQSDYFLETIEVFVYNIQGQLLVSENRSPNITIINLDVSNLLSGIYFVKVISGENSIIKRIIKK